MKKIIAISWTISVMLVVLTFVRVDAQTGGCWISGIGTIGCAGDTQRDTFGGNAMTMKSGAVRGEWTHISVDSEVIFNGKVSYLVCQYYTPLSGPEVPTAIPNYANFGGTGKLNGEAGYFFNVKVFDHGEPGIYLDRYTIDIFNSTYQPVYSADGQITRDCHECLDDVNVPSELAWVLNMGCISGGNFQIKPPNAGHPY